MKFLTEEDVKWQSLDVYTDAKERLNKKEYTVLWRDKFASRKSVGPCQNLARITGANTYEGFFDSYLKYANDNIDQPISSRGCTLDELEDVAYRWMTETGDPYKLGIKTFFYGVIMHVIIETLMGKVKEAEAMRAFNACGFSVEESTSDEDASMGIDFKVYKEGKLKWLVQIKPISFILGYKPDLVHDRQYVFVKHNLGKQKYPEASYLYLFYNSKESGKWIYNCDLKSYFFKYEDLVGNNGYPLLKKEDILRCQKDTIEI